MKKPLRCAIYTRKSTEEGLEQDFNSLDAQREACAAYIESQRHEGWRPVSSPYDDGGFSGGSMDRPALQRLLGDIGAGSVDVVVVYKVDRLTRSLTDFAKIVAIFDQADVSFVSVTQAFNTTTSMGRLTLNVLLSFAQFEREVTAERIRDKIAASKAKGIWMGGVPPIGYRAENRRLVLVPEEAALVRHIFERYLALKSVRLLQAELAELGHLTPVRVSRAGRQSGGCAFSTGKLYWILSNPVVIGKIRHREHVYQGMHEAIIDQEIWGKTQALLAANRRTHQARAKARHPSPLTGKLFDPDGKRMRTVHTSKGGRRYRYYTSPGLIESSRAAGATGWRLPAAELETVLAEAIRSRLKTAEIRSDLLTKIEDPAVVPIVMDAVNQIDADLKTPSSKPGKALLRAIVERVEIQESALRAKLDLCDAVGGLVGIQIGAPMTFEVSTPIRPARRGAELKLVLQGAACDAQSPDPGLIQTVLDARHRLAIYTDSQAPQSISHIAAGTGSDIADVSRSLQLAFLAPDLVEKILDGRQPAGLTATRLRRLEKLPLLWEEQRAVLS